MKNKMVMLCVIISICLVGCGGKSQEDYGENYEQTQDSQNFSAVREATATENGFYVIREDFIWFVDKKSEKTVPLCGKPNCKHKDHSCNAYFNVPLNIQAYDGSIYVIARGTKEMTVSLYRMSEDGSEREELKILYTYEEEDVSCSLDFVIHRGYGYMVTNWVQGDRAERTQTMYRISLDSSEEKEEIAKVKGFSPMLYIVEGCGNKIYFYTTCYTDKDGKYLEVINYELDILDKTVQKLNLPDGMSLIAVKNNRYFCGKKDEKGILSFDKNGDNEKDIFSWQYNDTLVYHDEQYLYLDNEAYLYLHDQPDTERRIAIIDYDGNIICEWKKFGSDTIFWSDSKQLLLKNPEEQSYQVLKLADVSSLK